MKTTETEKEFDLRKFILEYHQAKSVSEIADKLIEDHFEEVARFFRLNLRRLLTPYIRSVLGVRRKLAVNAFAKTSGAEKVSIIERLVNRVLAQKIFAFGKMLNLGDATVTELNECAESNYLRPGEIMISRGNALKEMANVLTEQKVSTLRELPLDVLTPLLKAFA